MISRRQALAGLALMAPASAALASGPLLLLNGQYIQGGGVLGRTRPRAKVFVDDELVGAASDRGAFFVGFDRDAKPQTTIRVRHPDGDAEHVAQIAAGVYDVQSIDGLPQDQVTPEDPALLARIAAEAQRKAVGFASDIDADFFAAGFVMPVKYTRRSASFGGQRILNGVPERPHYGTDLAAPIGTPIIAPAGGIVCFAETGLHYEGGLVFIDHGQGAISAYLHMSKVEVARGQTLTRGDRIGEVGKEGRATGPHLCWRMKWRGRNLDPALFVGVVAPPLIA